MTHFGGKKNPKPLQIREIKLWKTTKPDFQTVIDSQTNVQVELLEQRTWLLTTPTEERNPLTRIG